MEYLIHYMWKHRIFDAEQLKTTDGRTLQVIEPGIRNNNAGPDFFNARIRIDSTLWVGNVEIHDRASDWYRHHHDKDKAYDSVILHICGKADCKVTRSDGEEIPQLEMPVPEYIRDNYNVLKAAEVSPACHSILRELPMITKHSWLSSLQVERFTAKTETVIQRLEKSLNNWEDVFFISLARNFGFGVNGDTFERWANALPFRAMDKHRDNLTQIESIMFGMAGLLDKECNDTYFTTLKNEYTYLKHKFSLTEPNDLQWKMMRMRPGNFPYIRIAQLAFLYYSERGIFSQILECNSMDSLYPLLSVRTSDYWDTHYTFGRESPHRQKILSRQSAELIIINTVVPFLYAYGTFKGEEQYCDRALAFLEKLKPENNYIIRNWENAGIIPENAGDSQALIQLTHEYCERRRCFFCRFGYEYMKARR